LVFFIVPQAAGRARLYLLRSCDQSRRFAGPAGARTFLDSFRFACIPESEEFVESRPAGPCATYPMRDTWTDCPVTDGVVLIGNAAGYSNPHIGQGLSVALRDVRVLSVLLMASGLATMTGPESMPTSAFHKDVNKRICDQALLADIGRPRERSSSRRFG